MQMSAAGVVAVAHFVGMFGHEAERDLARGVFTDIEIGYSREHAHARDDEHHAQPSATAGV